MLCIECVLLVRTTHQVTMHETFEYIKCVSRSRYSMKGRQYNSQKENDIKANYITHNPKIEQHEYHLKPSVLRKGVYFLHPSCNCGLISSDKSWKRKGEHDCYYDKW
jgi:hypothetical protein